MLQGRWDYRRVKSQELMPYKRDKRGDYFTERYNEKIMGYAVEQPFDIDADDYCIYNTAPYALYPKVLTLYNSMNNDGTYDEYDEETIVKCLHQNYHLKNLTDPYLELSEKYHISVVKEEVKK